MRQRNDNRPNPRPDTKWANITNYPGDYGPDAAIVVDRNGRMIGRVFESYREAARNAARIQGATAHRIEDN